jgi:3-oxoacyl-[acyl-carrier protein] reductase
MDLGLKGRKAIVCASSRGLGRACAFALAREGCAVVINGRDKKRLDVTAAEIAGATGTKVSAVVADLNTEAGRAALIAACPDAGILVNNNGGPPPGKFDEWGRAEWLAAMEANMLAPIFMIKALVNGMRQRKFGRIVNITSARVKTPTATMGLSASARSGLTAFCKGLSIEVAADNVTINNLLPERIDTDRQSYMAERAAQASGETSSENVRHRIADSLPAKRYGTAEELADACAFLCSIQAGFISGQNLQLDGGNYRGLI